MSTDGHAHGVVETLTHPADHLAASSLEAGKNGKDHLGGYRLVRLLGEGGMGRVFVAEDVVLHRFLALKVMRPELAVQSKARERFLREARAAAQLQHDHVVPVWQVGEDRGMPFIVMPLLAGESLEARLRRDPPLTLAEILRVGRQTVVGLGAAHAAGLIHRDVKPANLWLETVPTEEGESRWRVKILDFGLARAVEADTGATPSGLLLGTPGYMAPEQALGELTDGRSDLFSLGCVLYRLLTGEAPFRGATLTAVLLAAIRSEPVPPLARNPDVPPTLSDLVMQMLAKEARQRPPSATAVAEVFRGLQETPGDIRQLETASRKIARGFSLVSVLWLRYAIAVGVGVVFLLLLLSLWQVFFSARPPCHHQGKAPENSPPSCP